jgi:hypothetical protein
MAENRLYGCVGELAGAGSLRVAEEVRPRVSASVDG